MKDGKDFLYHKKIARVTFNRPTLLHKARGRISRTEQSTPFPFRQLLSAVFRVENRTPVQGRTQKLIKGVLYRRGAARADPGICVTGGRPLPSIPPSLLSPSLHLPPLTFFLPSLIFPSPRSRAPLNQLGVWGSAIIFPNGFRIWCTL